MSAALLLTPQILETIAEQVSSEALRTLAHEFEMRCLEPLWLAPSEVELDLREESVAESFLTCSLDVLRELRAREPEDFARILAEIERQTSGTSEAIQRRLARDVNLYAARAFDRSWRIVLDVLNQTLPRVMELNESELEAAAQVERPWSDPLFRDAVLSQVYAVAVAAAAERPAPLPPLITALCSRAYRTATSFLRFAALIDPRESGLLRPRYRPLRSAAYRAAEQSAVNATFAGSRGPVLRAALAGARGRKPDLLD